MMLFVVCLFVFALLAEHVEHMLCYCTAYFHTGLICYDLL